MRPSRAVYKRGASEAGLGHLTRILGRSQDIGVLVALNSLVALRGLQGDLQTDQAARVKAVQCSGPGGPGNDRVGNPP